MNKSKPDPAPLRKALVAVEKSAADIRAAHEQKIKIQTEIDDYLATLETVGEDAVKLCSGKRTMLEMIPHMIAKLERARPALVDGLTQEIESFERTLGTCAASESESLLTKIAGLVRPYCRDYTSAGDTVDSARELAGRCQILGTIPVERIGSLSVPSWPRSNRPEAFDKAAVERATELLAIHAAWEKNGGAFASKNFSQAA